MWAKWKTLNAKAISGTPTAASFSCVLRVTNFVFIFSIFYIFFMLFCLPFAGLRVALCDVAAYHII